MGKKFYLYAVIVFYIIWLAILPLCFCVLANPILSAVEKNTGIKIELKNPRLITGIIPNVKIKADKMEIIDKNGAVPAFILISPRCSIRILPLLSGKIHVNYFEAESADLNLCYKDKFFYIGRCPLKNIGIKTIIDKIKLENCKISINESGEKYLINIENLYLKIRKKMFTLNGELKFSANGHTSSAVFDIDLNKNSQDKTKFNIRVKDFALEPISKLFARYIPGDIEKTEGRIDFYSDCNKMNTELKNIKIIYKDNNKSVVFPEIFKLISKHRISEDSIIIEEFNAFDERINQHGNKHKIGNPDINTKIFGEIKNIYTGSPILNLRTNIRISDIRKSALMLPPFITPDINIPKLKQYPFYGKMSGGLEIKGKLPHPDIYGNVRVTNGVLIKHIPQTKEGADISAEFKGQKVFLDVTVPAGGSEAVYVTGDITVYGEKYAHLKIKSSKSVNLNVAEHVLNPLHEILCFIIGPVPVMDIEGRGNIDIYITGTKKEPHVWGNFNFKNADARFLQINNAVLKNADGKLNFNNQNAYFENKTGTLNGTPVKIAGVCNLYGDLNFNTTANNQKLKDLVSILTGSPMLKPMASLVPPIRDINGTADFYLNLEGKVPDINKMEINKNIFPKGYIKLKGNSMKLYEIPLKNVKGLIEYNRMNCMFDLFSVQSSQIHTSGSIKDGIADIRINAPKFYVNDIDWLKYIDNLYTKFTIRYKGRIDKIEPGGLNAIVEIIKDKSPVKNGKILSGKITLNNSNLNIENLNGIIKHNPFNLRLNIKNMGNKSLNLEKARFNGEFNCREFDLTAVNFIKNAHILPYNLQKELDKINFIYGNANISAKIRDNKLNSFVKMNTVKLDYSVYENAGKEPVVVPIKLIDGGIAVKNNVMFLNKLNCLVDDMPLLVFGKINGLYKNPCYCIRLSSKLVQKVFDKYWNAYNIYPIKMNGDILYSSLITGDKNKTHIKTKIRMEENSSIYYLGASAGDTANPIVINFDADINKSGNTVKLNRFEYNKLIASQNNKQNELPLLLISGGITKSGKIYGFNDVTVRTENPANANFFNVIFRKPTIKQGIFTSDLKINGTSANPRIIGKFYVNGLNMPYLNTTIKDLSLDFKPDNIYIAAKGEVLSNYITINGRLKNRLIPPYQINDTEIYINDFDINHSIDKLKQIELNGLSSAISQDAENTGGNILNSVIFNNLKIKAGNIQVKNIKASNLEAVCSLNEKMQMYVETFMFNMANGTITGNAGYNILNNFMKMELNAKEVNANALTTALFDLPNQIHGLLTGHIEFSCNASDDKTKAATLNGYGTFNVSDGRMPKLGSLEYLLKAGNLLKGGITSLSMNGIIDIITPVKTGGFSNITGQLRIKDGVAKTIEIHSHGKDLSLYIAGILDLNTKIAEMKVFGQISRKISTILGAAGNLSLNTLFNKIPGISLDKDSPFLNDLNKIPGIELSNKASRKFMVEISGDINGEDFVKSFKWIN